MLRLSLPPSHIDWPHPALIHAMCAVAARYSDRVKCCTISESMAKTQAEDAGHKDYGSMEGMEDIANESCFAEQNFKYSQVLAKMEGVVGRKLLEVLQAHVSDVEVCIPRRLNHFNREH